MRFSKAVFKGRYSPIGVDLGTTNVKLLQFREERKKIFLHSTLILPRDVIPIGNDKDYESALALKLKKKLGGAGFVKKRDANICVGNNNYIIRSFKLPPMADKDIAEAVKWEAEYRITMPSTDRVTDYIYERGKGVDGKESITVHLVAAPRDIVNDYLFIMAKTGVNPLSVEIESFALHRIFKIAAKSKNRDERGKNNISLVVDLGGESVNILILEDDIYAYCRHIKPGINSLMGKAVSIKENLTDKAYGIYYKKGSLNEPGFNEIASRIVADTNQALDNYCYRIRDREGRASCNEIFLCGGGANTAGIDVFFRDIAGEGKEVARLNIFDFLGIGDAEQLAEGEKMLFNVAGGLALRGWLKYER